MKIGLFGFTFAHENMGCQALTCSLIEILKMVCHEPLEIVSFHDELTLGVIPDLFPDIRFSKCRVSVKDPKLKFLKEVKTCDIIFDVTYGDGFSDIYFTKSIYKNALVKIMCEKTKVPFVLMPQTYGPFKHKTLEILAGRAIHGATVAYARDSISAQYAKKLSKRKVGAVTDMAFFLPYSSTSKHLGNKAGINISGLLWKGGFHGKTNQFGMKTDYVVYCKKIIEYLLSKNFEVHLIPHVTKSGNPRRVIPDADYPVCKELHEMYPSTVLAPNFNTPYEAKNYISEMDIFVGSRMHATIGAFSSGVITIPFAYSRKFKGLFENFGYSYFVDGTMTDTEKSIDSTIKLIEEREILREAQNSSLNKISVLKEEFVNELLAIINRACK